MNVIGAELARLVRDRAGDRCEYCRMSQALQGGTFHVEHVVPRAHGGTSTPENLAWACPGCNLGKSSRIEAIDPETERLVPLYHPRRDVWNAHFHWVDRTLFSTTSVGRATIAALNLNQPRRLLIREAEALFGWFPPE